VLVAEPRPALRRQIGLALRRAGLEVDFAADVGDAMFLASRHDYRVVVLDPEMQARQGLDLCRDLTRGMTGTAPAVVALSRSGSIVARLRARLAGARACLVRPLSLEQFVDTVCRLSGQQTSTLAALPGPT
jgi:DNA-binding response OmpR family regulator